VQPPIFEERQDFIIVTFKAAMVDGASFEEYSQKNAQKTTQSATQ